MLALTYGGTAGTTILRNCEINKATAGILLQYQSRCNYQGLLYRTKRRVQYRLLQQLNSAYQCTRQLFTFILFYLPLMRIN